MLPRNQRMELLSRAYVQALVAHAGGICSTPTPDFGIDFNIHRVALKDGHYSDEGPALYVQLKSETDVPYDEGKDSYAYDLEVKAYNRLRKAGVNVNCFLVLYTMPADELQWMTQNHNGLTLRECAYYLSLAGMPETGNDHRIRVFVPRQQVFSVAFLQEQFQER